MRAPSVVVVLIAACGGGGGDPDRPDAAHPDAGTGACQEREAYAMFRVVPEPGGSQRYGGQFSGQVQSATTPETIAPIAEAAGCRFVGPRPELCDPPCDGGDVCDVHGACLPYPEQVDGGTVTITGTDPRVELEPSIGFNYYSQNSYPGFFARGAALTLDIEGSADTPAVQITTTGVPMLVLPTNQLVAREHQDMVIAWTALADVPGAEVMIHMDNDHHGIRAYVECVGDAAAGTLTVPAAILDRLIEAGETGIGTYIENAWIEQRARGWTRTDRGCAGVASHSDQLVQVETIRAE